MPSKLRQTSARVSFFAFQDMITTVTGVLLIVMLMLSMEATQRVENSADPARRALQQEVQQAREQLAARLEVLRQQQAAVSALAHRIFVLPKPDSSGRQPVLVVLSATNGWCARLGQTNRTEFEAASDRDGFEKVLVTCDPRHDRLVFYVRPSGVAHFQACRRRAEQRAFAIGYDAAEEDGQYLLTQ